MHPDFQIGDTVRSVDYDMYDACREHGAIILTAHEHSYSRLIKKTYYNNEQFSFFFLYSFLRFVRYCAFWAMRVSLTSNLMEFTKTNTEVLKNWDKKTKTFLLYKKKRTSIQRRGSKKTPQLSPTSPRNPNIFFLKRTPFF